VICVLAVVSLAACVVLLVVKLREMLWYRSMANWAAAWWIGVAIVAQAGVLAGVLVSLWGGWRLTVSPDAVELRRLGSGATRYRWSAEMGVSVNVRVVGTARNGEAVGELLLGDGPVTALGDRYVKDLLTIAGLMRRASDGDAAMADVVWPVRFRGPRTDWVRLVIAVLVGLVVMAFAMFLYSGLFAMPSCGFL